MMVRNGVDSGALSASVVVCTRNRAELVRHAVETLLAQSIDDRLYEIVVVDNGSTDATQAVLRRQQAENPGSRIVLVREGRPGLGRARNAGVRRAEGRYVGFLDDDAAAAPDWIEKVLACFHSFQPEPMGVGGKILPMYEAGKPAWFKDEYETRTWGDEPRFLRKGESFSGSNMFFRRDVLTRFESFDERVGMTGETLSLGEETALFDAIWASCDADRMLCYSPELVVFHLVPRWKMCLRYRLKRSFASGQALAVSQPASGVIGRVKKTAGAVAAFGYYAARALGACRSWPGWRNWVYEDVGPVVAAFGKCAACLGVRVSMKQV